MNAGTRNVEPALAERPGLRFSDGSGGVAMNAGTRNVEPVAERLGMGSDGSGGGVAMDAGTEHVEHTGVAVWQ